ncbi:hypothetical protein GCM10010420_49720 [Streptomyces glaucosporus]|uniref:Integral membrane protein n=1 Tax=Streptomyces glaucosporus TaxID=284044 RepID=A0ABN3IVH0_9ACTN
MRDSRGSADDNPFAPPPEGRPEQPWRPRLPDGSGSAAAGEEGDGDRDRSGNSSPDWGGRWSSRQPHRDGGGFGGSGPEGPGARDGGPGGMRWDPTDPVQRRARYALLAGMWAFFFALFGFPWVATPLGALAVYWGIGSLRAKPGAEAGTQPGGARAAATAEDVAGTARQDAPGAGAAAPGAHGRGYRPPTSAAISGLITGLVALGVIGAQFSVQIVYRDYFVCVEDALTSASRDACERHLPENLRPLFGESGTE